MTNPVSVITTKDVTTALIYFTELSMILSVDKEGYIYSTATPDHKRIEIGSGDQRKPVVIYQEELPKADIYVINPFAEGYGDRTPPQIFFYKMQRAALNARMSYAVDGVLQLALEQQTQSATAKTTKKKTEEEPPLRLGIRITSILTRKVNADKLVVEDVDDKMTAEFHQFFDKFGDQVIEPVYKPHQQRSDILISILDDPAFLINLSFMRKKSITVLQAIIRGILDLAPDETTDRFSSKRIENCPSKFSSWVQAIYLLYKPLNEVIDLLPDVTATDHLVDLDAYQFHLDRLPAYTNNAKWMIQSAAPITSTPAKAPGLPNLTPNTPSYLPPLHTATTDVPPGYKLMPGMIMPDGTRGPPSMIPDPTQTQQMPLPGYGAPSPYIPQQTIMPQSQYAQPPGYFNQAPLQPSMGYMGQPNSGYVNPLMAGGQPQPVFNQGFSVIPNMPVIR